MSAEGRPPESLMSAEAQLMGDMTKFDLTPVMKVRAAGCDHKTRQKSFLVNVVKLEKSKLLTDRTTDKVT